jgi:hypothetical protein
MKRVSLYDILLVVRVYYSAIEVSKTVSWLAQCRNLVSAININFIYFGGVLKGGRCISYASSSHFLTNFVIKVPSLKLSKQLHVKIDVFTVLHFGVYVKVRFDESF